jgi:hypothetical protein
MDILRFLFYAFLLYLAFRLVFDFILPMYRTTKRIRKGFREMQERMNRHTEPHQQENYSTSNPSNSTRGSAGEYIDFEEIKD